jgi:hypothetical protein
MQFFDCFLYQPCGNFTRCLVASTSFKSISIVLIFTVHFHKHKIITISTNTKSARE